MHSDHGFVRRYRLLSMLLLSVFVSVGVGSCSDDEDTPTQPTSFALLLTNNTAIEYNVYQRPSSAGDVFGKVGVSISGATYRINPLTPGTDYVFRLVRYGQGVEQHDHEKNVSSSGDDVVWEVK